MSNDYRAVYRNMKIARRFDLVEGKWPRRKLADRVDLWFAWAFVAAMGIVLATDVWRYGL